MIEMTCRQSAISFSTIADKTHAELQAETSPPGKRKPINRVLQKRYYFYD